MTGLNERQSSLLPHDCIVDSRRIEELRMSSDHLAVVNPSTGEPLALIACSTADDTRQAIQTADAAWPAWRERSAKERGDILRRWYELLLEHEEDLASVITAEQGKPLGEARGEVRYAAAFVQWFGEEAKRVYGDTIPASKANQQLIVLKQAVGVCAAITPWNFPAAMLTRKVAPALAAGCPIIVKPASATPLTALALAELAYRAGVPRDVLAVVCGSASAIGGELTASPLVRKLSFTGSTEVGRQLMAACSGTVKRLSLELGGNAPFIVFESADLDAAVEGALQSKFRNMGQTCVASNRFYVHERVYDAFAARFAAAVERLTVGDGFEPGVEQGPLINAQAVAVVERHIADAVAKGARLLTGGRRHARGGHFFQPTVLVDVPDDAQLTCEETFGPVAALIRFHDEAALLRRANATEYGLAAYFYSRDLGQVWRVGQALEFGMIGVNSGLLSNEAAPFGGIKQSGYGREGSKYGIDEYLELKYLCLGF